MGLLINTNSAALQAATNLERNQVNLQGDLGQLSSGLKINSAADNPAGLVISEQMLSQITGLNQAVTNSTNAVSMTQTAEGALDEVNTLLDNARQLTLDAANTGVNDSEQASADQAELDNVISSITRISQVTQFGTKNLLNGSLNGISNASSSLSHIVAGNLANNPAIAPGVMTVKVVAGTQSTFTLNSASTGNSYIFSGGTVTGLEMGSNKIVSGVSVTLTVAGKTSTITAGAGGLKASGIATALNALTGANNLTQQGYVVSATTNGQLKVSTIKAGTVASGFAASVTFSRGADASVLGNNYQKTVTLGFATGSAGTSTGAAAVMFTNASALSGVISTSKLAQNVVVTATVTASGGGTYTVSFTGAAGGSSMSSVLSGLSTQLQGKTGTVFSGATFKLGTGTVASGIQVVLAMGKNSTKEFTVSLAVDFNNAPAKRTTVNFQSIIASGYSTGTTSGGAHATFANTTTATGTYTGAALSGGNYLKSGNQVIVVIDGHTVTISGKQTLSGIASALQTAIQVFSGLTGVHVNFETISGQLSLITGAQGISTGLKTASAGFAFSTNDGKPLTVSLRIDQADTTDVVSASSTLVTGQQGKLTPDLVTTAVSSGTHVADGHASGSITSTSGTTGLDVGAVTSATLKTATGLSLNLALTFIKSGGAATLSLTSGMNAKGFQGLSIEISSGLETNGGDATFNLGQGAVFQVGANAGQTVGLTIQSTASTELGRNADSKLTSLDDLSSENASALTTGQTTAALTIIDAAITQITNLRGQLGAFQADTLQAGLSSLQVADQNLTSAQGTIVDVDFAAASADFSKNQILVQSSTAMLAQANQLPQNVLKLIGA